MGVTWRWCAGAAGLKGAGWKKVGLIAHPNSSALWIAAFKNYVEVVRALLAWRGPREHRVVPDYNTVNSAACEGNVEVLRALLEWKGPARERVDISVARTAARHKGIAEICTRVLAVCGEVKSRKAGNKRRGGPTCGQAGSRPPSSSGDRPDQWDRYTFLLPPAPVSTQHVCTPVEDGACTGGHPRNTNA